MKWKYNIHHKVIHSQLHVSINGEQSKLVIRIFVVQLDRNYNLQLIATKSCTNYLCSFLSVIMGSLHLM